jgi:hypothetical protein
MELVSAHLRSNCGLINTSKPIREQVAVSVRVRHVVGLSRSPVKTKAYCARFTDSLDFYAGGPELISGLTDVSIK